MWPKPVRVVDTGGLKSAPIVDPAGRALLYSVPAVNPLRRPPEAGQPGRAGQVGEERQAVAREGQAETAIARDAAAAGRQPASFSIVGLATRRRSIVAGPAAPASAACPTPPYRG